MEKRPAELEGMQALPSDASTTKAPQTPKTLPSAHARRVEAALRGLQAQLCDRLAALDGRASFEETPWQRAEGGGGITRVLEQGALWEKAGVLFSAIQGRRLPSGALSASSSAKNPSLAERGTQPAPEPVLKPRAEHPFFATGVSLILHPRNPYVPTVHLNVRYFETQSNYWYGGGMDLTPYYPFREDCIHFHREIKECCDRFDPHYYPRFKAWCDRYFYLPHREEARGIGGIFFNELRDGLESGLAFLIALGEAFQRAYCPLVEQRKELPYGQREVNFQRWRRGRYAEFNLLYDQGTRFGLQSNGRVESIFVSLPPAVEWRYNWEAVPGSREALLAGFLKPQDWAEQTS